jgi:O-antigen ligase
MLALGLAGALALSISLLPLTWALLLVAGGIAFVATLVHPQLGVLLIVPAVPFGSLRQWTVGGLNVSLTEALVVLAVSAWLMRMVALRNARVSIPPLVLPLTAMVGAFLLSLFASGSLPASLKEIAKWVEVLALFVLVSNEFGRRWNQALVAVILGTGAAVALHGIYQFVFKVGPEAFVLFERFMRAHGTFEQPNPYAGYLGLTLPLAVGLVGVGVLRVGGRVRWTWLVWAAGCGGLMFVALIMSWSRGAWLGVAMAIGVMVIALVVHSGRAAVLAGVLAVLLGYVLLAGGLARLPQAIVQRFSDLVPYLGVVDVRGLEVTDANFAVLERMAHWQSAVGMWTDRVWLGVGIGNYAAVYPRYALPLWPLPLGHAHNYYLNVAAETGVVGLLVYVWLWVAALLTSWRAVQRSGGWQLGVALGVLGMVVHLSVHNLFDNLYVHGMYLHIAILLGVIAANAQDQRLD